MNIGNNRIENPEVTVNRHASTLAEIRRMHDEYRAMQDELSDARRTIDQQQNKIELLEHTLHQTRSERNICQRKLIRLAEAMSMMHTLSEKAHAIMLDAKEWEEQYHQEEQTEVQGEPDDVQRKSASEIVALIKNAGQTGNGQG
jgi:hypothetical protein